MPVVMRAVRGRLSVIGLWLVSSGCDGGYPLAPTACDEWCRTSQRKHCSEDDPAGCVSMCERDRQIAARCNDLLLTVVDCYDRIPDSAFACDGYTTYLTNQYYCDHERYALQTCAQPSATSCFTFCQNFVSRCEGQLIASCGTGCNVDDECLDPFQAYYTCLDRSGLACDISNFDQICQAESAALDACRGRLED